MEPEIILRDGNFIRRITSEQILGTQEAILSGLVETQPTMLPNFMPFGDGMLHLLLSKTHLVVITELKTLPMTAYWRVSDSDATKLVLDWDSTPPNSMQRGSIRIEDVWTVPANAGKCLLCLQMSLGTDGYAASRCYLLQYVGKELYVLPYPNVYNDGRVCMGTGWERTMNSQKGIIPSFIHAHTSFHATALNRDLTGDYTSAMFKRTLAGWDFPSDPKAFMRSTSLSFMAGFTL
jgi:hypothetical protein